MVKTLIFYAALSMSLSTQAQNGAIIEFTATQAGDKVLLQFTFSQGNTCNDTQIQRADSALGFATIGIIPGVCGSDESEESYTYVDSFPRPGEVNFYRISLAGLSYSDTVSLQVVPSIPGRLLLFPNPTADMINISMPAGATRTIAVWNGNGKMVHSIETTEAFMALDVRALAPGFYVIGVEEQGETVYSATFVKL